MYFDFGQNLLKFNGVNELNTFLTTTVTSQPTLYKERISILTLAGGDAAPVPGAAESNDYSSTNVQVAGVDEADIVKTDGEYIYLVSKEKVIIVKAYPAETAQVVSEISLNGSIWNLYINEVL